MSFTTIMEMALQAVCLSGIFAGVIWFASGFLHLEKRKRRYIFLCSWYLVSLFYVTLFRHGLDMSLQFNSIDQVINLTPIMNTWKLYQNGSTVVFLYNIIGNIAWFFPLGLLLGHQRKLIQVIFIGGGLSMIIELLQFLLEIGTTDIDDVIFNIIGTVLGFACIYVLNYVKLQRNTND